jgi:amidophosphoribosyltransferase
MGGLFGVASRGECLKDLFYGTDYHSHLGTVRGGMVVHNGEDFHREIKDITKDQFRSKMEDSLEGFKGKKGLGVISDHEDQPVIIRSHLGRYALVNVGRIDNLGALAARAFRNGAGERAPHFAETAPDEEHVNPAELVGTLINEGEDFVKGIENMQELVQGSSTGALLTGKGELYIWRDRFGRTPAIIGTRGRGATEGPQAKAATFETTAFPNLGFEIEKYLGPGEVVKMDADKCETVSPAGDRMAICSFLWVYYGYPPSNYEDINVEIVRNRCGAAQAKRDKEEDLSIDVVAGIPDSGTGHAIGYANEAGIPYRRPFVKYTPTWPRSFMPQDQRIRDLVARMKLIPIRELIRGLKALFCEDSIVRGTQLQDTIQRLYDAGALEVHMRPACPPLIYGCKFLNFSTSESELDLAGRKAIADLGDHEPNLSLYANPDTVEHSNMVEGVRERLNLTSLRYQRLGDLVDAIGFPEGKLCTHCFNGRSGGVCSDELYTIEQAPTL